MWPVWGYGSGAADEEAAAAAGALRHRRPARAAGHARTHSLFWALIKELKMS